MPLDVVFSATLLSPARGPEHAVDRRDVGRQTSEPNGRPEREEAGAAGSMTVAVSPWETVELSLFDRQGYVRPATRCRRRRHRFPYPQLRLPLTDALRHRLQSSLGREYQLERELGHGGMAVVFVAEDLKHRRKVAVKVLRPELGEAVGAERFLREIEIAAGLRRSMAPE